MKTQIHELHHTEAGGQSAFTQYMEASRTDYEKFSKHTTRAIVAATIVIALATAATPFCNHYWPPTAPPQVVAAPPPTCLQWMPSR
jgi:hypothetical protein